MCTLDHCCRRTIFHSLHLPYTLCCWIYLAYQNKQIYIYTYVYIYIYACMSPVFVIKFCLPQGHGQGYIMSHSGSFRGFQRDKLATRFWSACLSSGICWMNLVQVPSHIHTHWLRSKDFSCASSLPFHAIWLVFLEWFDVLSDSLQQKSCFGSFACLQVSGRFGFPLIDDNRELNSFWTLGMPFQASYDASRPPKLSVYILCDITYII